MYAIRARIAYMNYTKSKGYLTLKALVVTIVAIATPVHTASHNYSLLDHSHPDMWINLSK